ncbi:MAG: sulfurtransferase [Lautropia sp.]
MTRRWTTLISVEELAAAIDHCVVIDCRHDLADTSAGERAYAEGHIPSAHFLHMDRDLSGPMTGSNGRHPLPDREAFRRRLEALGVSDDTQLVAYDSHGGAMAGRVWAMARWLGHDAVAVLDGDLRAWRTAGYPLATEPTPAPARPGRLDPARPSRLALVPVDAIVAAIASPDALQVDALQVLDARAAERYSGAVEPIDPVAGHIPGAINRFHGRNLRPDGRFKPAEALRDEFEALLGDRDPASIVHQCGSGVTACHNLLAMEHAGIPGSRLYAGSWSEWVADPGRPVARGS